MPKQLEIKMTDGGMEIVSEALRQMSPRMPTTEAEGLRAVEHALELVACAAMQAEVLMTTIGIPEAVREASMHGTLSLAYQAAEDFLD